MVAGWPNKRNLENLKWLTSKTWMRSLSVHCNVSSSGMMYSYTSSQTSKTCDTLCSLGTMAQVSRVRNFFLHIIDSFFAGKTLLLDAAVDTLSQMENTKVLFFMALGETRSHLVNIPLPLHTSVCRMWDNYLLLLMSLRGWIRLYGLTYDNILCFLDYPRIEKKSDDILDIMFR